MEEKEAEVKSDKKFESYTVNGKTGETVYIKPDGTWNRDGDGVPIVLGDGTYYTPVKAEAFWADEKPKD